MLQERVDGAAFLHGGGAGLAGGRGRADGAGGDGAFRRLVHRAAGGQALGAGCLARRRGGAPGGRGAGPGGEGDGGGGEVAGRAVGWRGLGGGKSEDPRFVRRGAEEQKAGAHVRVPGGLGHFGFAAGAADENFILGAGQRDIEQAVIFLRLGGGVGGRGGGDGLGAQLFPGAEDGHEGARLLRHREPVQGFRGFRERGCIGQDDDGRLQAFGAMHGHDADLIARGLRLAFDGRTGAAERFQKKFQRPGLGLDKSEGFGEEFVDWLGGVLAQAAQQAGAAAERAERFVEQGEGG